VVREYTAAIEIVFFDEILIFCQMMLISQVNLINFLFAIDLFIPHGHCYLWKPELVGLHVLSDGLIALAYYSIPLTLFYFVRKRQDLPFIWIFLLFSAFIVACGTTHLLEIWTLWYPTYWLSGAVKLTTALISLVTAGLLVSIVPKALALPSPAQLELANRAIKQEIAERTRIEAELIRNRDLREAIFNESADALFLVDPQTLLTLDCNQRAVELFQATDRACLIGIEGHTLQRHQFTQDQLHKIVTEMQSKRFWSGEIEYVTCQGNCFLGNIAAKPITIAEQVINLVRVTDISYRKQSEVALQQSEARYRAIVQDQTELIVRFQPDGTVTLPITNSVAPIQNQKGLVTGAVLIFRDDTQRQLRRKRNKTMEQVQRLQHQHEELEQLNLLKDDFLNTVSHELRTPLSNIRMAVQMLEIVLNQQEAANTAIDPTSDRIKRYIRILRDQCDQELGLVNDLLELQQFQAWVYPIERVAISLHEWIPSRIETFQERALSRELRLQAIVTPDLPVLISDVSILTRMLVELLSNACKYTPPGEEITVTVQAPSENRIQIIVSNTGVEIARDELTRIFDKFYRIPTSDRWQQGGTGLGLALIKKSIAYLNGSVWAESNTMQTQFIVELPLSPPSAALESTSKSD
jgi:signal transduction histidine kinase